MMNKKNTMNKILLKKNGFSFVELIIVISVIWIIYILTESFFLPYDFPSLSKRMNRKLNEEAMNNCFKNQSILEGAIEFYNMDQSPMLNTAIPGRDFENIQDILIKKNYLKDCLEIPCDSCSYGFVDILATGSVFCKMHGNKRSEYNKPIIPNYDKRLETPFSSDYQLIRNRFVEKRKRKEKIYDFYVFLLSPTMAVILIIFNIAIIIASVVWQKNKKKEDNSVENLDMNKSNQ